MTQRLWASVVNPHKHQSCVPCRIQTQTTILWLLRPHVPNHSRMARGPVSRSIENISVLVPSLNLESTTKDLLGLPHRVLIWNQTTLFCRSRHLGTDVDFLIANFGPSTNGESEVVGPQHCFEPWSLVFPQ